MKGKIVAHSREGEWQNQCIRNDKDLVHVQLRKLKIQRTQARTESQENLVKLTLESNATLKALKKVVEKVKDRERSMGTKPRNLAGANRILGGVGAGPTLLPHTLDTLLSFSTLSFK